MTTGRINQVAFLGADTRENIVHSIATHSYEYLDGVSTDYLNIECATV